MVYTGSGIDMLYNFLAAGSTVRPTHLFFGNDAGTLISSITMADIDNDFVRKAVTFTKNPTALNYEVILLSTDGVGSYIDRFGLVTEATLDAGVLVTLDESATGSKNSTFETTVTGELIIEEA